MKKLLICVLAVCLVLAGAVAAEQLPDLTYPSALETESVDNVPLITPKTIEFNINNIDDVNDLDATVTVSVDQTILLYDEEQRQMTVTVSPKDPLLPTIDTPILDATFETFTIDISIAEDMDDGLYQTNIIIDNGTVDGIDTIPLSIYVISDFCDNNGVGSDIRIDSVDITETELDVGETIELEVEVSNKNSDDPVRVIVEAWLYDLTDSDTVAEVESDSIKIEERDDATFELSFRPEPKDIEAENDLVLYVKAYKKGAADEQCHMSSGEEVSFDREEYMIVFNSFEVSPDPTVTGITCGDKVSVTVNMENIGEEDEEEAYVKLIEPTLLGTTGLTSALFDLNDGKKTSEIFTFDVPKDIAAGDYNLEAVVYFDEGDGKTSEFLDAITIACEAAVPADRVTLTLVEDQIAGLTNQMITIPFTITNNEDSDQVYTVEISAVDDWSEAETKTMTVKSKETSTEYAYLTPVEDTEAGSYKATITVKDSDGETLTTKAVDVDLTKGTGPTGFFGKIGSFFKNMFSGSGALTTTIWLIIDVALIVLAIWVLKLIFAKK